MKISDIEPKLIEIGEKKLYGHTIQTSLAEDQMSQLWRGFRLRCAEFELEGTFYSVAVYPNTMRGFNPTTTFERWTLIEADAENLPDDFQQLIIPEGNYIHFTYKGKAMDYPSVARYLFGEWIPNSPHELDDRPHFEVLAKNYNPFDENAQEEVYIPVK